MNDLITVAEAADIAQVHDRTVRRWLREERITKHVTGTGRVRVSEAEVRRLVTPAPAPAVTGV